MTTYERHLVWDQYKQPDSFYFSCWQNNHARGSESKRFELENIFHPHSTHWFWLRHLPYRRTLSTCILQNGFNSRANVLRTPPTRNNENRHNRWTGLADGQPVSKCHCRSLYRIWAGNDSILQIRGVKFSWKNSYEGVRFNVIIGGGGCMGGHVCQTWPLLHHAYRRL